MKTYLLNEQQLWWFTKLENNTLVSEAMDISFEICPDFH